ncbi:MAG: tetratricopeptide repeat protein [Lentisphaeria bacterium]|nr:tetratricopeptide repeat protein [Lentisphaeria bacterium]
MKNLQNKNLLLFLIPVIAGVIARAVYLSTFAALPVMEHVVGPDVSEYFNAAMHLCNVSLLPEFGIHAPLYPYFLAGLITLTRGDLFMVRLLQSSLLLVLMLLPLFLTLQKRFAGISSPKNKIPFLSCLILSLYPTLIVYQTDFFSENLMLVFLLWALWCYFLHRKAADFFAGLCTGAALLTHPGCIFFVPCALLYSFFRKKDWKVQKFKRASTYLLGVILLVAPLCLYNSLQEKRPVFIQKNGMFNLWLGNSYSANGTCVLSPGLRWDKEAERAELTSRKRGISEDRFYQEEIFHFIKNHPVRYTLNLLKKAAMALNAREYTTWSDVTAAKEIFWHKYLFQGWFMVLFLLGSVILFRGIFSTHTRKIFAPEYLLFAAIFAGQIFFLTAGRYRLPLIVPLAVFSAYLLCSIRQYVGGPRMTARTLMCFVLSFGIASFAFQIPAAPEMEYARSLLASACLKAGQPEIVVKQYEKPMKNEFFPERRINLLSQAYLDLKDYKNAEKYCKEAVILLKYQPQTHLNYASVLLETGRFQEAEKSLAEAAVRTKDTALLADIHYNHAEICSRTKRFAEAEKYLRKTLELYPSHRKALNNLGVLLIRMGKPAESVNFFEQAVRIEPGNTRLQVNLAAALAMSGKINEARTMLERILFKEPDCLPARRLFEQISKK